MPYEIRPVSDVLTARNDRRQEEERWAEGSRLGSVAAPSSTAATAATAAAPESSATARSLLAGLVDRECPSAEFPSVQRVDGRIRICLAAHFHEGEPAGTTRVSVGDDLHLGDLAPALREQSSELCFVRVKWQIPNVQPRPHRPQPPSPRHCGTVSHPERSS